MLLSGYGGLKLQAGRRRGRKPRVRKNNLAFGGRIWVVLGTLWFLCAPPLLAQGTTADQEQNSGSTSGQSPDPDPLSTMFPHPESDRFWISGQANLISQWHPAFHSPYV